MNLQMKLYTPVLILVLYCNTCISDEGPYVTIEEGVIKGQYQKTWKGKTLRAFTGIPYAQPPIKNLRFKVALPVKPWIGVLDATKSHNICPQIDIFIHDYEVKGNEDCLYLNVYTPEILENELLPVMFFIHGGGFTSGYANADLYGPNLLVEKNIIFVTANYRLGALGFLSTEDHVLPGNIGLKDQNVALKWIKKNIINFGGDHNRITVFGQSAGGASTHYHTLSPLSKDLLFGAIAHSGSAFAPWAFAPIGEAKNNFKRLAEFLNCPTTSSESALNCLMEADAYDIVEQDKKFMEWTYDPVTPFKPVAEPLHAGAFISDQPLNIVKSGKIGNIPFISGFTSEDGAIKTAAIFNESKHAEEFNKDFNTLLPLILLYRGYPKTAEITKKLKEFYLGNGVIDESKKSELTDLFTDLLFMYPNILTVELHSKYGKAPVYSFIFRYRGSSSYSTEFGDSSHDYGVCHCDDLLYLMTSDFLGYESLTDSDKNMIEIMTTIWTNFAKTGNPTPTKDKSIPEWKPVGGNNLEYLLIDKDSSIKMIQNPYSKRTDFWKNLQADFNVKRIKIEL